MNNKVALITGASKGIGRAIAVNLAKSNIDVVINYNGDLEGAEKTEELCKEYGVKTLIQQGDVKNSKVVEEMFGNIINEFGKIDILINNAGITRDNLIIRMKDEEFEDVIETNLISAFYTMKEASKLMMRKREGTIINISSVVGIRGNIGQVNYSASKAGLIGMTKSIAKELGSRNVRVNAVAPGFIDTKMTDKLNEKTKKEILKSIPLGKLGEVEDVAALVRFLVSDDAKYITGQVISVDGGMNI